MQKLILVTVLLCVQCSVYCQSSKQKVPQSKSTTKKNVLQLTPFRTEIYDMRNNDTKLVSIFDGPQSNMLVTIESKRIVFQKGTKELIWIINSRQTSKDQTQVHYNCNKQTGFVLNYKTKVLAQINEQTEAMFVYYF
ncbi:MAG: hypothetical protein BGO31_03305 [Bacteroidetes bacterium 43-16]|nr:MAG: hypothetical protein BGO31_03305 [Bacteroidetes bacterium 43-16]